MNFLRRFGQSLFRLVGGRARPSHFTADAEIQQVSEAYALDARDFAERAFSITLDWSDGSVKRVEAILDNLCRQKRTIEPPPSDEQLVTFAEMLGSYIGEVFRRNHGADWGMVHIDGDPFPVCGLEARSCSGQRPRGQCPALLSELVEGAPQEQAMVAEMAIRA